MTYCHKIFSDWSLRQEKHNSGSTRLKSDRISLAAARIFISRKKNSREAIFCESKTCFFFTEIPVTHLFSRIEQKQFLHKYRHFVCFRRYWSNLRKKNSRVVGRSLSLHLLCFLWTLMVIAIDFGDCYQGDWRRWEPELSLSNHQGCHSLHFRFLNWLSFSYVTSIVTATMQ